MRLAPLVICLFFLANLSVAETAAPETKQKPATHETEKSTKALERTTVQEAAQEKPAETPPKQETVKKDISSESKPKAAEEKEAGALFSVEEAEETDKEKTDIHKQVPPRGENEDKSLYTVNEAEKAAAEKVAPPKKRVRKPLTIKRRAEKEKKKKVSTSRRKTKKKEEWKKIELGFGYKGIQMLRGSYSFETHFIGEMINESGRDYGIVKFLFSTYDKRGKLITEEAFQITDFYNGQIKEFSGTVIDTYKTIATQKVKFLSAAPTSKGG